MRITAGSTIIVALSLLVPYADTPAYGAGNGANPNGKPFVALQGQIVEVQGAVSSIQDQIESLVRRVGTVEERVVANGEAVANLQRQNAELQAQISAYGTTAEALQQRILDLQAEIVVLQDQIASSGNAALQAQIDYNTGLISQLQQTVSGLTTLEAQVANNTALISALQDETNYINLRLEIKQDIVYQKCPEGQAVRQIFPDGRVACQSAGGGATNISIYSVFNMVPLPKNSTGSLEVACAGGDRVTGGGFVGMTSSGSVVLMSSPVVSPSGCDAWKVKLRNNTLQDDYLVGSAQCLAVTP